jgi:hypothetical protein
MVTRRVLTSIVIAGIISLWANTTTAQSTAGATVAQGPTRAMGKPFSGRLTTAAARDVSPAPSGQFGMLYAVLDGKGKLAINGTFEGLAAPATVAHFHHGVDGQRGPSVATLTVTKGTSGVLKGDVMLTAADIAELQKGLFYVQIDTATAAEGEVRGWLLSGMLK